LYQGRPGGAVILARTKLAMLLILFAGPWSVSVARGPWSVARRPLVGAGVACWGLRLRLVGFCTSEAGHVVEKPWSDSVARGPWSAGWGASSRAGAQGCRSWVSARTKLAMLLERVVVRFRRPLVGSRRRLLARTAAAAIFGKNVDFFDGILQTWSPPFYAHSATRVGGCNRLSAASC